LQNDAYYYYYDDDLYDPDMPLPKHKSSKRQQQQQPAGDDFHSIVTTLKRALRRPGLPRPRPHRTKQQIKVR